MLGELKTNNDIYVFLQRLQSLFYCHVLLTLGLFYTHIKSPLITHLNFIIGNYAYVYIFMCICIQARDVGCPWS